MSWRSRSVQCYPCSKWVHLRCPLPFFSRFKTLDSSHSWICPPCFFWRSHIHQHCVFLFGHFQFVYLPCSTWSIWPPLPTQRSRPTLVFKSVTLVLPTSYLFPLHPSHPLMILVGFLYLVHYLVVILQQLPAHLLS